MTPRNHLLTIPSIEDLTRREFMSSALAAALLIACGEDEGNEADDSLATRTYVDWTGSSSEIPTKPQRVVALSDINLAAPMLDLGVKPIGMIQRAGNFIAAVAEAFDTSSIQPVGNIGAPDVEMIAQLQPDLILDYGLLQEGSRTSGHAALHESLRAIAPVVTLYAFESSLSEFTEEIADVLGADKSRLAELTGDFQSRIAGLKSRFPGDLASVRVSHVILGANNALHYYSREANHLEMQVLRAVGFDLPQLPEAAGSGVIASMSIERIREIDADAIFYYQGTLSNPQASSVTDLELWKQLKAVQAGQAYNLGVSVGGMTFRAANQVLDVIEAAVLAPRFDPDIF